VWNELALELESGFLNRVSEAKFTPGFTLGSTPGFSPYSHSANITDRSESIALFSLISLKIVVVCHLKIVKGQNMRRAFYGSEG